MVRSLMAVTMMCLLLLLTSINFFIYAGVKNDAPEVVLACGGDEDSSDTYPSSPAGPDEKSPGNAVSLTEEYIHDIEHVEDQFWINALFQHKIHEAEKLSIVHFERLSPPPEA